MSLLARGWGLHERGQDKKSIETWGRGLTRIANECARVGLPVPEVKEEYGCITTTFRRPDWTGANTPDQRTGTGVATTGTTSVISGTIVATTGTGATRTGTGRGLSGTGWTIIGMTAPDNVGELLARLPKLRKDARANVESVLHELVTDKNATIPQICARTGMALRTINNALATFAQQKSCFPVRLQKSRTRVQKNSRLVRRNSRLIPKNRQLALRNRQLETKNCTLTPKNCTLGRRNCTLKVH